MSTEGIKLLKELRRVREKGTMEDEDEPLSGT